MGEVKDYPPYLDYPKPRKPMTNADKLRSMSDEELADWFVSLGGEVCPFVGDCQLSCRQCWLDWLREEATE